MILEQLGVCMEKNVLSWWPSSHICLWELDCEKGRTPKNLCLWTVVLEKTPESFLDSKEIKPVNLRVNQPWILIGRTDAESKAPIFWSPDANSWLTRKVPDAGKDWGQKEKSMSEDEMAGWYHQAVNMNLGKLRKTMRGREVWSAVVHVVAKSWTRLADWTTIMKNIGLPWWLSDNLPANSGNTGFILGSGRSPREGNGNSLPYSCLENSKDKGAWPAIVHGSQKSPTWLNV